MIKKAVGGFSPYAIIAILYYSELLGSYALGMMILSISLLSSSLLEIPIGVISDFIGRKQTLVAGAVSYILMLIAFIWAAYVERDYVFWVLTLAAFLHGLTIALNSGTTEAFLYETVEALGIKDDYKKYYGWGGSAHQFFAGFSAFLGGVIAYYWSYEACYMVNLFPAMILLVNNLLIVRVDNEKYDKNDNVFTHIKYAFKEFKKNRGLRYVASASILREAAGLAMHRFEVAYFQTLIPEYILGLPRMLKQMMGTFSFFFAHKFLAGLGHIKALVAATLGGLAVKLFGLLLNNFATPFIMSAYNLCFGVIMTGNSDLMQKEFTAKQRATMGSLVSMVSHLLVAVFGVALGWIADAYSLRTALFSFLIFDLVICVLYLRVKEKK
ncbi:MAG: MFS transporter [Lactobacillus sp.]|nr:MFS transporter [Lactobacillus sp.]